jgi:hypothetical protein
LPLAALLPLASTTVAGGKAKPKPVKCKAGQIKVKAGKKKARCRPIKVALPRPRTSDPRGARQGRREGARARADHGDRDGSGRAGEPLWRERRRTREQHHQ